MQTGDKNKEKYQLGDFKLIQYQILQANNLRIMWQTVRRFSNEIMEVKGLIKCAEQELETVSTCFIAPSPPLSKISSYCMGH